MAKPKLNPALCVCLKELKRGLEARDGCLEGGLWEGKFFPLMFNCFVSAVFPFYKLHCCMDVVRNDKHMPSLK